MRGWLLTNLGGSLGTTPMKLPHSTPSPTLYHSTNGKYLRVCIRPLFRDSSFFLRGEVGGRNGGIVVVGGKCGGYSVGGFSDGGYSVGVGMNGGYSVGTSGVDGGYPVIGVNAG